MKYCQETKGRKLAQKTSGKAEHRTRPSVQEWVLWTEFQTRGIQGAAASSTEEAAAWGSCLGCSLRVRGHTTSTLIQASKQVPLLGSSPAWHFWVNVCVSASWWLELCLFWSRSSLGKTGRGQRVLNWMQTRQRRLECMLRSPLRIHFSQGLHAAWAIQPLGDTMCGRGFQNIAPS